MNPITVRHILNNAIPINTTCTFVNSPVGIISNNSNKNNSIEAEPEQITEVINQEWDYRTNIDGTGQTQNGRSMGWPNTKLNGPKDRN